MSYEEFGFGHRPRRRKIVKYRDPRRKNGPRHGYRRCQPANAPRVEPCQRAFELAHAQSALTHGDEAAGWGAAIYHGMIHAAIRGGSALEALPSLLERLPLPHADRYRAILMSDVELPDGLGNGTVWICLAQAVRVLR